MGEESGSEMKCLAPSPNASTTWGAGAHRSRLHNPEVPVFIHKYWLTARDKMLSWPGRGPGSLLEELRIGWGRQVGSKY